MDTEEKDDKAAETPVEEPAGSDMEELSASLDDAVEDIVEPEGDDEGDEGGDSPEVKVEPEADEPEGDDDDDDDEISDDLLTKAVAAGLSIAEARKFSDPELLESMVARLSGDEGASDDSSEGEGEGEPEGANPFDEIPDLDPDIYDDDLVNTFKAMKGLLKTQSDEIVSLKQQGAQAGDAAAINTMIAGLSKERLSAIGGADGSRASDGSDASAKRAELTGKVNALTAGYKATGVDIPLAGVFKEAAQIVFADVDAEAKVKAARKRSQKHINRAGSRRSAESGRDPKEAVADELRDQFSFK